MQQAVLCKHKHTAVFCFYQLPQIVQSVIFIGF